MNKFFLIPFAGLIAPASCSSDEPAGNDKPFVICPTPVGRNIVEAQNNFSCDFFRLASAKAEEPNMVISPLSLSMALSMVANGAEGETLSEILTTLGMRSSLGEINELNNLLLQSFPIADKKVTVSFANSIWIDNEFPVLDNFVNINKECYKAEVNNVDIGTEETKNLINKWAEKHTKGLIKDLLHKPLDAGTKLALFNALYFKGKWANKFNKDKTIRAPFHNADGKETRVRMMCAYSLPLKALEDDGLTAVTLPYGNGSFAMTLVLPAENMTIDECISMLDGKRLSQWHSYNENGSTIEAEVQLPKFEIEYGAELNDHLQAMGIKSAFCADADCSNLSNFSLYINKVFQKARIIVDEEGTEAAAVTGVSMDLMSPIGPDNKSFVFDRPFVFYISERSTSSILFMGKVTKL